MKGVDTLARRFNERAVLAHPGHADQSVHGRKSKGSRSLPPPTGKPISTNPHTAPPGSMRAVELAESKSPPMFPKQGGGQISRSDAAARMYGTGSKQHKAAQAMDAKSLEKPAAGSTSPPSVITSTQGRKGWTKPFAYGGQHEVNFHNNVGVGGIHVDRNGNTGAYAHRVNGKTGDLVRVTARFKPGNDEKAISWVERTMQQAAEDIDAQFK